MICFVRFQFSSILAFTVAAIFISNSIKAVKSSAQCNQSCEGHPNRVPYPFGFSNGCKIPLNCTQGRIRIGRFEVENITSDSILVNLPPKCNRTVQQIQPLFGPNYALAWQNGLLLNNCTTRLDGCLIPTTMVEARFGSSSDCGSGSRNLSCYSGTNNGSGFIGYDNLTGTGCDFLFSSIAAVGDDGINSTVSLRFQAVELGWWLDACESAKGAECMNFTVPSGGLGCRCQCKEGLIGDGFAGGSGCRKVTKKCGDTEQPISHDCDDDDDFMAGFTWRIVLIGYGCGFLIGATMGFAMFLIGRARWFTRILGEQPRRKVVRISQIGWRRSHQS